MITDAQLLDDARGLKASLDARARHRGIHATMKTYDDARVLAEQQLRHALGAYIAIANPSLPHQAPHKEPNPNA